MNAMDAIEQGQLVNRPEMRAGDTVKVVTPGGTREFEILKLTTIHDEAAG